MELNVDRRTVYRFHIYDLSDGSLIGKANTQERVEQIIEQELIANPNAKPAVLDLRINMDL